jgi:hypothetical protein
MAVVWAVPPSDVLRGTFNRHGRKLRYRNCPAGRAEKAFDHQTGCRYRSGYYPFHRGPPFGKVLYNKITADNSDHQRAGDAGSVLLVGPRWRPVDAAVNGGGRRRVTKWPPTLLPRSLSGSIIEGGNRDRLRVRGLPRIETV